MNGKSRSPLLRPTGFWRMRRGEREEFLMLRMAPPEEEALTILEELFVKGTTVAADRSDWPSMTATSVFCRSSMETEIRLDDQKKGR